MSLSRIGYREYVRRTAMEVETAKRTEKEKELELIVLENLRGIANMEYYSDTTHNTQTYVIYLKPDMNYKLFEE